MKLRDTHSTAVAPAQAQTSFGDLERYVDRSLADWKTPGASLALVKNGKIVLTRGFGVRSVEGTARVDENTLFAIGSCSKAFGSGSVAALVGDGKIGWDEPLRKHLPDLQLWDPWVTEHISVRDMLSHRTGSSLAVEGRGAETMRLPEEWVKRLRYETPDAGFRERYVYSNAMYVAAALMVERVTERAKSPFPRSRRPHSRRAGGRAFWPSSTPKWRTRPYGVNDHI